MLPYTGSGPYCYANSVSMMLGDASPGPDVIEVLTGSPFGFQLLGGRSPQFDPYGWDPGIGIDDAITRLGFACDRTEGGTAEDAHDRLRAAVAAGPAMIGPVEFGLLRHDPSMTGPIGADHYVVALAVDDGLVTFHDPHAYPYATLPVGDFLKAWHAETLNYGAPFTMRTRFRRESDVDAPAALRAAIPGAVDWLTGRTDLEIPPAHLGGAAGLAALAELIAAGPSTDLRAHLVYFAIRVGARRLNDAAVCLRRLTLPAAAAAAADLSRRVGSLQFDLIAGEHARAADTVAGLASGYDRYREALAAV